VDWVKHPERSRSAVAGEVFGTAPRELARAVSLQQVVEMVRVTIDVVEARVDELAAPGGEAELREAVLHYTREVAFAAARVYARTAEARGAWDARLEALVVDSLVRGEVGEGVHSWASALNWSSAPVAVIVGTAEGDEPAVLIDELRADRPPGPARPARGRAGEQARGGARRHRRPLTGSPAFAGPVRPGPLVVGPVVTDLYAPRLRRRRPGRHARRARLARRAPAGAGLRPAARARARRRRGRPRGSSLRRSTSPCSAAARRSSTP
jgi:hypothetical protein